MSPADQLATLIRLQGYCDRIRFHKNAGRKISLRGMGR